MKGHKHILPLIVGAQFACTSLWFACNAILSELIQSHGLQEHVLGHLTSAIQFGFISGTLSFALLNVADRFSPSKVFFVCSILAAAFNACLILHGHSIVTLLLLRFGTGFFLAGIYPVGMKIAADYYKSGLGRSLGFLVGALVLGTAFPHLLKACYSFIPWIWVAILPSILSILGGLIMIALVPDGPYRKPQTKLDLTAFWNVFRNKKFRVAAFGYFGHMWELYTFWTFVPVILIAFKNQHEHLSYNVSILSFVIIAVGSLACIVGGILSEKYGPKKLAFRFLFLSATCCLLFPFFYFFTSVNIFLAFLIFWGIVVIADSPLFSTLVAKNAEAKIKGTALTIVNCIGFAITILSIEFFNTLFAANASFYLFILLAIGPIFSLSFYIKNQRSS